MFRLIGTDADRYYSWDLKPGKHIVGRDPECELFVQNKTVSRNHAELLVSEGGDSCTVTDLGSHNGTAVNGNILTEPKQLKPGDHVQFGQAEFKLSGDGAAPRSTSRTSPTIIADDSLEKSVLLSMDEALKPLPSKVTDMPELLPTLFEMARLLVLPEPMETMLERSLEMVNKIVPTDRLAVLFISSQGEVTTAASIQSGKMGTENFTLSRTIVSEILDNKSAVLIVDAAEDPRFADQQSIIMSQMKSAMAVPLLDEERVLGILYCETTNPIRRYNDAFLRLFATIGNIIASRLVNFSLLKERQAREVYEAELQRASMIQKTLAPKELPQLPGYTIEAYQEQCRAVGGDLYDLTMLPDGRLLFLVADVSGKGLGAALLMSNILASFRILYNSENFDLARAVRQTSLQLFKHSAPDNFATLFTGIVDREKNVINFVNAGHNPPILIKKDGTIAKLEASGIMIGAFEEGAWVEDSAPMEPGELLVIFTDGIPEAGIEKGEYSDERLEKLVAANMEKGPRELADIIVADVDAFEDHEGHSDDITMVIIKRDN